MNDHDRLDLLRPILAECRAEYERRTERQRVRVRTAVPLPDDQRQQLMSMLREMYGQEPVLVTEIDPALLGGIVVRVGD